MFRPIRRIGIFGITVVAAMFCTSPARGIIVGDPNATPADSPANHVDANVTSSPYAGVVGIDVSGVGPATGVLLRTTDPTHAYVLTAGHVVDPNHNGTVVAPSAITISLNYSGARSSFMSVSAIHVNPNWYTGSNPSHDDLTVLQLTAPAPAGVPTYNLFRTPYTTTKTITLVGYGQSGDGVNGATVGSDTSIKRVGMNVAEGAEADDDSASTTNEFFYFDFDRPNGTNGPLGGSSLGNTSEVNFGIGDSGGPSFVTVGSELQIFGINTTGLTFNGTDPFPKFGSGGGGQVASAYTSFIDQYTGMPEPSALGLVAFALPMLARRRRR